MLRLRRKKTELPTSPVKYPHGTFVKTEKGYFYIVNDSKRYRLVSKRVLDSWAPHRVVNTTEAAVAAYKVAAKMKFRNGSLIWNISDAKIYLIEGGKRRQIVSPEWFLTLGLDPSDLSYNMKQIQIVSLDEVNLHEEGEVLN